MPRDTSAISTYGSFAVDRDALEIRDERGQHVSVGPQGVRLFLLLYDRMDEVVTREEIYAALWPESEADVNRALNTLVRQLRMGLGDEASAPRFIRTYQARGYRLLPVVAPRETPHERAVPVVAARRRIRRTVTITGVAVAAMALLVARSSRDAGGARADAPRLTREQGEWVSRGRYLLRRGDEGDGEQAARLLQRALESGAGTRGLRANLSEAHFLAGRIDDANRVAREATVREPDVAEGWFMAGVTAHLVHWDWPTAERQLAQAIRLSPHEARFHSALAFVLATAGDRAAARVALENAVRSGGVDALTTADVGHIARLVGDESLAATYCEKSLELADRPGTRECLAAARLALGDTVAARRALGSHVRGSLAEWRARQAREAEETARASDRGWYRAAELLALAGEDERALAALATAIDRCEPWAVMAPASPAFVRVGRDARWAAVVRGVRERVNGVDSLRDRRDARRRAATRVIGIQIGRTRQTQRRCARGA